MEAEANASHADAPLQLSGSAGTPLSDLLGSLISHGEGTPPRDETGSGTGSQANTPFASADGQVSEQAATAEGDAPAVPTFPIPLGDMPPAGQQGGQSSASGQASSSHLGSSSRARHIYQPCQRDQPHQRVDYASPNVGLVAGLRTFPKPDMLEGKMPRRGEPGDFIRRPLNSEDERQQGGAPSTPPRKSAVADKIRTLLNRTRSPGRGRAEPRAEEPRLQGSSTSIAAPAPAATSTLGLFTPEASQVAVPDADLKE